MANDTEYGRSPDGSGHSAEPEPSCTVSAVPVSVPNAVEHVARAIAANKRRLPVDDAKIDRVWNGYCGQARAAINAMAQLREAELREHERLGMLWRNPAPCAAPQAISGPTYRCWVDATGRSGLVK